MTITDTLPELVLRSIDATWSYAHWERLPGDGNRYEVIDGVLYMTTVPSSFHQWIVQQLFLELHAQITRPQLGVVFIAPIGVLMPGCDPVQPDVVVVGNAEIGIIADRRIRGVPNMLIEVLSPANAETDTEIKRKSYARAGVPEYWIVRPAERDILVYTEPDATLGDYIHLDRVPPDGTLAATTFPIHIMVASLFEGAPDLTV